MNLLILYAFLATLFTYFITALGASLVFFFKSVNKKILDVMLGISSGIMIAASFWSLLSPAISLCNDLGRNNFIEPAIGFILGGVLIIISDILLEKTNINKKDDKKSLLLTFAVTMHNIPEGMAVGVAFGLISLGIPQATLASAILLALGIGLQNFPEGACVSMPLKATGKSPKQAFLIGQASGLVEPIAGIIGSIFSLTIQNCLPFILSFSAGSMIAVVCSELIPDAFEDNKTLATIGVISGFVLMMILDIALN